MIYRKSGNGVTLWEEVVIENTDRCFTWYLPDDEYGGDYACRVWQYDATHHPLVFEDSKLKTILSERVDAFHSYKDRYCCTGETAAVPNQIPIDNIECYIPGQNSNLIYGYSYNHKVFTGTGELKYPALADTNSYNWRPCVINCTVSGLSLIAAGSTINCTSWDNSDSFPEPYENAEITGEKEGLTRVQLKAILDGAHGNWAAPRVPNITAGDVTDSIFVECVIDAPGMPIDKSMISNQGSTDSAVIAINALAEGEVRANSFIEGSCITGSYAQLIGDVIRIKNSIITFDWGDVVSVSKLQLINYKGQLRYFSGKGLTYVNYHMIGGGAWTIVNGSTFSPVYLQVINDYNNVVEHELSDENAFYFAYQPDVAVINVIFKNCTWKPNTSIWFTGSYPATEAACGVTFLIEDYHFDPTDGNPAWGSKDGYDATFNLSNHLVVPHVTKDIAQYGIPTNALSEICNGANEDARGGFLSERLTDEVDFSKLFNGSLGRASTANNAKSYRFIDYDDFDGNGEPCEW